MLNLFFKFKKVFSFALILLLSTSLFAEVQFGVRAIGSLTMENTFTDEEKAQQNIQIKRYATAYNSPVAKSNTTFGWGFAAFANINLGRFGLQPEVIYSKNNTLSWKIKEKDSFLATSKATRTYSYDSIDIPSSSNITTTSPVGSNFVFQLSLGTKIILDRK